MWLYHASTCIQPIIALVVIVVSFAYWSRSHQRGFLWIGSAYLLLLTTDLLHLLINLAGRSPRTWGWLIGSVYLSRIVFNILIFFGLRSFYTEFRRSKGSLRTGPIRWKVVSLVIRRLFFTTTGSIFILVGPIVALSNRTSVGVGCVTTLMGLACLWLGLHPGSPLAKTATRNGEPIADRGQTFDNQEPREGIEPSSGTELGANPKEETP